MKTTIFNQPLTADSLLEITKQFPKHADIKNIEFGKCDYILPGRNLLIGTFQISLTDYEAVVASERFGPCIVLVERNKVLVPEQLEKTHYLAVVAHIDGVHSNRFTFRDCSNHSSTQPIIKTQDLGISSVSTVPYKNPMTTVVFEETPINVVLLIPYLNNNVAEAISVELIRDQQGGVYIDYDREKAGVAKALTDLDEEERKN